MVEQPSFEAYLDILDSQIPEILVPRANLQKIREVSRELPLVSFAALECWLGAHPARTDINISFAGILGEHALLRDWIETHRSSYHAKKSDTYARYSSFCTNWSQPDFYLISFINQFWLVFDFPDHRKEILPWYYLSFMENSLTKSPRVKSEIVLQTLKLFKEERIIQDFEEVWRPFLDNIPDSIILNTIGVQTNRSVDYLRVYLSVFSFQDVLRFLNNNKWPGEVDDLEAQLRDLVPDCSLFGLSLDCDPALQPKISIELWFTQESRGKKKALRKLGDKLVGLGLLSPEESRAFRDWEGELHIDHNAEHWSWPKDYSSTLKSDRILIKKMYYFKIVYIPREKIRAKGYLCFDRPVLANQ